MLPSDLLWDRAFIGKKWQSRYGLGVVKDGRQNVRWAPVEIQRLYDIRLDFGPQLRNAPAHVALIIHLPLTSFIRYCTLMVYVKIIKSLVFPPKVTMYWRRIFLVRAKDRPVNEFIHEQTTPLFFEKEYRIHQSEGKLQKKTFSSCILGLPSPHTPIFAKQETWQGKSGLLP